MTSWNGYPPENEDGYHVIASPLGRNPMVFLWLKEKSTWVGQNANGNHSAAEMAGCTYWGRVSYD